MTRSEEKLGVGTTERESGRAQLRKYLVEDEVTETVRKEEVEVDAEGRTSG